MDESVVYIGIVGSRRRNSIADKELIFDLISELKEKYGDRLTIVSGGCKKGADRFCKNACRKLKIDYEEYLPDLIKGMTYFEAVKRYHARNYRIAKRINDTLFAMVSRDRKGGTENTIKHASALGKNVILL